MSWHCNQIINQLRQMQMISSSSWWEQVRVECKVDWS